MTIFKVNVAVADLRREPDAIDSKRFKDPLQESQLLYGENVRILNRKNDWVFVEALEQQKCMPDMSWKGYPGWILEKNLIETPKSATPNLIIHDLWASVHTQNSEKSPEIIELSLGTRICSSKKVGNWYSLNLMNGSTGFIEEKHVREIKSSREFNDLSRNEIIAMGTKMVGAPYFWGGRSAYRSDWLTPLTGVDCSGLVQLLYLIQGIQIPRDAHDQFLLSKRVEPSEMLIGDLIFTSMESNPHRMGHVMLYAGENELLEATAASQSVRRFSLSERLGSKLNELTWGERNIFFGRV